MQNIKMFQPNCISVFSKKLNQKITNEKCKKLIESKNIFLSLQTSTRNTRKETTHPYYSFFEGYGLGGGLISLLSNREQQDRPSFCAVGIAVGEEQLYLRMAGDQVEVRYFKIMFTNHINLSSKVTLVQFEVIRCIYDECWL